MCNYYFDYIIVSLTITLIFIPGDILLYVSVQKNEVIRLVLQLSVHVNSFELASFLSQKNQKRKNNDNISDFLNSL